MLGGLALAFIAGLLSIASPCVLPLLPIVFGAAASKHRFGPAALAAGLSTAFVVAGLVIATVGFTIGLGADRVRLWSAGLLALVGCVLFFPSLQARVTAAAGPFGAWAEKRFGGRAGESAWGQFGVGLLLGAVWSPCVGPTLGAASVLAAQGRDLGQVLVTMVLFGAGACVPLLLLGVLSREALMRWRGRLLVTGARTKRVFGAVLVLAGLLVLSGADWKAETVLVDASPPWLTDLTTRF